MTKPTPRPWRVDYTYPKWPMIIGADGSHVNVDFENAADAELIVMAVNACDSPDAMFQLPDPVPDDVGYVEWHGVPVRMP